MPCESLGSDKDKDEEFIEKGVGGEILRSVMEHNIESMDLLGGVTTTVETETIEMANTNDMDCHISDMEPLINSTDNIEINDTDVVNDADFVSDNLRGRVRFEFKIEKFSELSIQSSSLFKCRNIPFHLHVARTDDIDPKLSIYLARGLPNGHGPNEDNIQDEDGLKIDVTVAISLVDSLSGKFFHKCSFLNHTYRANSNWGFDNFVAIKVLTDDTHFASCYVNDSITIRVDMIADPPYCCDNSRAITGYVGIKNQGMTCYMNSLLEVLFFLKKFRTACYRIPTEMDDDFSMALALQKVFYNLQYSNDAVCTKNLTRSFGWSPTDSFMQHDIQEMMRVLVDKIESRMKNTLLENAISSMFQGTFISYVKCRNVDFTSHREEIFYDIQLSLENANNIYDAFNQYVSTEILDNDNKYDAGKFGFQSADKGIIFSKLPPVLFLHLLRFQFDATQNMAVKNNNFFEFYNHIDLTAYVISGESTTPRSTYTLFAVLVHSGSGSYGHYVAYINPLLDNNWFKFDDNTISIVHPCDAINGNFGIEGKDEWEKSWQGLAYMLVYIRDSDAPEILAPVDPKYISDELVISVKTDQMRESDSWYTDNSCDIYLFFEEHLELDFRFERTRSPQSCSILQMLKFNVSTGIPAKYFKQKVSKEFKISNANQLRIWPISHAMSSVSYPFYVEDDEIFVNFLTGFKHRNQFSASVWVELALPGCELAPFDPNKDALIFYYFYCASRCSTFYIGHGYHDRSKKVADLVPSLNGLMLKIDHQWIYRELNIYELRGRCEIRQLEMFNNLLDGIEPSYKTYAMNIVFEPKEYDMSSTLYSAYLYYDDLQHHVNLFLRNVDDHPRRKEIYFHISLNTTLQQLTDWLAIRINYHREKIQFFNAGNAIPSTSTETLKTLLTRSASYKQCMFYRLHLVKTIDVETKKQFNVRWVSIDTKYSEEFSLYISNDETVESILAMVPKIRQIDFIGSGKLRLLCVMNDNKQLRLVKDSKEIYDFLNNHNCWSYFRIEEIPEGEDKLDDTERLVTVFHFSSFGKSDEANPPFIIKINLMEEWQYVKEQLRLRLKLSEAAWKDYRVVIFSSDGDQQLEIDDRETISDISRFIIGLDHTNNKTINEELQPVKFLEKSITIND